MKGLIKKDLFMIKSNVKYFLIYAILYSFMLYQEKEASSSISFILPFITIIMMISTFSYDEYNKWNAYAVTLPNGRKNVIKSKYITTALIIILASILSLTISFVIGSIKNNIAADEITTLIGSVFACILIISIVYPFLFKYGPEKGRIVMFALSFIIIGAAAILSKVPNLKLSVSLIVFLTRYGILLLIGSSLIIITISYIISKRIFNKKEF